MSLQQHLQNNNVLRRSHKTDFVNGSNTSTNPLSRERSFVKQSNAQKRRSQTMASLKAANKPAMELYRPPNVRTDLLPGMQPQQHPHNGKLNVHAKEFTMSHELQQSRSSGNLSHYLNYPGGLEHKGIRHMPIVMPSMPVPLMHSATSIIVPHGHRVNFQTPEYISNSNSASGPTTSTFNPPCLKRSKSMIETHHRLKCVNNDEIDLSTFPPEDKANLTSALDDPNALPSRTLMDLVKVILDKVVEGMRYSEAGAKLCAKIISRERTSTFIETLVNTCQQWYQERDRILRGVKAGDGTRFTAFMWFLTEMCAQLKRLQMHDNSNDEGTQPDLVLLSVLGKCCLACVSLPIRCITETECLFFVLTSIGRDLENELPTLLEQLMASVRDGFLASAGSPSIRRTLLQLIELHASKWQLPGSSVLYYYPRNK